jgi:hypothetical protein
MTVESFLTRELNIRFIDARNSASEARLSLGIQGYPTKAEETKIYAKAIELFRRRPEKEMIRMRQLSADLNAVKISACSFSDSSDTTSSCGLGGEKNSSFRGRTLKLWPTRHR